MFVRCEGNSAGKVRKLAMNIQPYCTWENFDCKRLYYNSYNAVYFIIKINKSAMQYTKTNFVVNFNFNLKLNDHLKTFWPKFAKMLFAIVYLFFCKF